MQCNRVLGHTNLSAAALSLRYLLGASCNWSMAKTCNSMTLEDRPCLVVLAVAFTGLQLNVAAYPMP